MEFQAILDLWVIRRCCHIKTPELWDNIVNQYMRILESGQYSIAEAKQVMQQAIQEIRKPLAKT